MFAFSCILYFYYWILLRSTGFDWRWVWGLGLSLGAMAALKENFIIYVISLMIAEVMTRVADSGFKVGPAFGGLSQRLKSKEFWLGTGATLAIALGVIWITYSAVGRDPNGFTNFFRAFGLWAETGDKGNGHQKPFMYWLNLMTQYEWMAMLGLVLAPFALRKVPSEIRLLSVVSVGMWLAYSIVNYKTPWCVLSFYWGFVFVAAYWANRWWKDHRFWVQGLFVVGCLISAKQSYNAAYAEPDQEGHPYIYGQTYRDLMVPLDRLIDEAREKPELFKAKRIQVISTFTWPLPYILGEFKQTGFYGEANAPAVLDGDVIIIDTTIEPNYSGRIKDVSRYERLQVRARQWASQLTIYRKL
jgi:hypothetical protein